MNATAAAPRARAAAKAVGTGPAAIATAGLRKSYGAVTVLDGIDLTVRAGTVFALLGPNGAGKTTMVRILTTLLPPDSGTAAVFGADVVRTPEAARRHFSLTGQYAAVDELLTGEENLVMMGRLNHLGGAGARRRAAELLDRFDLVDARKRRVRTYSGGMRRRLDLAISLIADPPVIFLDEPTTGLDPRSRRAVWAAIARLVESGSTIFLTTQYLEEADQLADRVAVLHGGRVVADGTPAELKDGMARTLVELRFAADDAYGAAAALLSGPDVRAEPESLVLRVPGAGDAAQVKHLLDLLEAHDVHISRLTLSEPTLDEVFLSLTDPAAHHSAADTNQDAT
ncbi:ABC-2 type transport system ATP-binding protein [Murinocardiopsis flavida]|uniref:ABC-2 type transport system ATP-binding protein n=1 Tax=Murinocardiopsis flavida TaxID=645275 RepID=A0A2P8DGH0_9ACTN|nr:ATP-binding cassette domain-containing protein [Murinocardiopsis flavida]PSK96289.1 ABC-2 type transport system ATP-binding protein [Murinocardiopsis flavida]